MRGSHGKLLRSSAAWCFLLLLHSPLLPAEPAVAEPGHLYLNVGTVDTAALENLAARDGHSARTAAFETGRPYVFQLAGPIMPEQESALRAAGVALGEYLPQFAYVATLSGVSPAALDGLEFVTWIGEFRNEWKLDPELGRRATRSAERRALAQRGLCRVSVTLFENRGAGRVIGFLKHQPDSEIHSVEAEGPVWAIGATIRQSDAPRIASLEEVHYIEEAPEITSRNVSTRWILQSNVQDLTPLYNNGITGAGEIAGVMDTPVNRDHCSFRDPVNNTPGASHRKIVAYNAPFGYDLHGTHVACTAVGQDYAGGTGDTRGVAYGARLVYSPIPGAPFTEAGFYNSALNAQVQGARIHTNSWGNDLTANYDGLCRGIDRFCYENETAVVCFAITAEATLKNPENAKNLIAVGAGDDAPSQQFHCQGGAGPTADGRRKPELLAPGCDIASAGGSGQSCATSVLTGTSMAAPAVAGAALLVRQYFTGGYYPTGVASPSNVFFPSGALIKAILLNACADMTGVGGYPSDQEGWGRPLLDNSLYFSGDARKLIVLADIRNPSGMSTGQEHTYLLTVTGATEQLRATLVWTDPAASASTGTANAAVNDLDLEMTAPNANFYRGNYFVSGGSAPNGVKDAKNNVEQVHVNTPWTGVWTIKVKAAAVNQGAQGYALVMTGQLSTQIPPPTISAISPASANSAAIVNIDPVNGTNFQIFGATSVRLRRSGQPDIVANNVTVQYSTRLTCTFDLIAAEDAFYDVVVINPDGQSAQLSNGFRVYVNCLKGDMNRDGTVNGADIRRFVQLLSGAAGYPIERCAGDVESPPDGTVDMGDVRFFVECLLGDACHG